MKRGSDPAAARAAVAEALRASGKYARVSDDTIVWAAARAVERSKNAKEAEKRAKRKLHQIAAGFAEHRDLERARRALAEIVDQASESEGDARSAADAARADGDSPTEGATQTVVAPRDERLRAWCRETMRLHASTAERLPVLERAWAELGALADFASARSVVDVGCGLNPLARPWMGLPSDARYDAIDIDGGSLDVVADFFAAAKLAGNAARRNAVLAPPTERVDVAILLKTLNNLDQQAAGAGEAALLALPFDRAIVSFPLRTLGGRDVGMRENYRARFEEFLARVGWRAESLELGGELYFVVRRGAS